MNILLNSKLCICNIQLEIRTLFYASRSGLVDAIPLRLVKTFSHKIFEMVLAPWMPLLPPLLPLLLLPEMNVGLLSRGNRTAITPTISLHFRPKYEHRIKMVWVFFLSSHSHEKPQPHIHNIVLILNLRMGEKKSRTPGK